MEVQQGKKKYSKRQYVVAVAEKKHYQNGL